MASSEQQIQKNKNRKVYTTEIIEQLKKDRAAGYDIDFTPFFEKDMDLRAPNITFEMTEWEYNEYMKCYQDPLYFIENYCKFRTDYGDTLVTLRDFQKEIIEIITSEEYNEDLDLFIPKNRNVIWMAARQSSKTTTLCAILAHKLIFSYSNCIAYANKEDTSKELVAKTSNIFKGLPFFLKPGCLNFGQTGFQLENGSRLLSSSTTNTASIGFTIHFMILDEFAHIPENIVNNFWRSVYPTLSSSKVSQCLIISTPNGVTNKFYDIWSKATTGQGITDAQGKKSSWIPYRVDYWQVPGHDEAWAEQMKADFGEEEFAQEFELQFNKHSKMLMKTDSANFIERLATNFVHKPIHIQNQYLNDENLVWHPDFDPNNIDPMKRYIMIVDLAEGNEDADQYLNSKEKTPDANSINIFEMRLNSVANIRRYSNTSCKAEDCVRFVQVGRFTCNTEDEIYCARVCSALSYNLFRDHERDDVRVMLEMNFNGKSFFEEFRRHNCYSGATILKTFHKKPIPGEKNKRKPGFKTTQNKESYCIKGNKLLSKHRTVIRDKATFEQMKSFGYVRGKLKGIACHDDLSMPVFNHIPRMLDEQLFVSWIQEFIYYNPDKYKVYQINELIKQWALDNPDMSDAAFAELYGLNDSDTTPLSMSIEYQQQTNPFSESNPFMNRDAGVDLSPYSSTYQGAFNPYSESGISGNTAFGFEVNRNILHY